MSDPYYRTPAWKRLRAAALERDGYRCTAPGCGGTHRLTVDHVVARRQGGPDSTDNLRTLCGTCDARVREDAAGRRRGGGLFGGCDAAGQPLDARHWWNGGENRERAIGGTYQPGTGRENLSGRRGETVRWGPREVSSAPPRPRGGR